jgi:hypothetical protein
MGFEFFLKEIGCENGEWINLAQIINNWRALEQTVTNIQFA